MDSSPEKKSNNLPIPALASLLFASLAILVQQFIPLESLRPRAAHSEYYVYQGIQDVNVRLWQDPFTTLPQHDSSLYNTGLCQSLPRHDATALACSITEAYRKSRDKSIIVLGVMVFSGPYAENVESRRRTRYAVLSGLSVNDYAPEDSEHIGYFEKPTTMKFLPEKVPFEWFNARNDGSPVLVLWLDETTFTSEPLKAARELVEFLDAKTKKAASNIKVDPPGLNFKFIGPASSTTLQAMVDELETALKETGADPDQLVKADQNGDKKINLIEYLKSHPFEFYDASASGDWPGLTFPSDNKDTNFQLYLKNLGLSPLLTRISLTDNQLASAVLEELKLRGFKIDSVCEKKPELELCHVNNEDHIVLISEWDTLYGRESLPKAMNKALVPWLEGCKQKKSEKECSPKWIHSFGYMRGLDGVVPGEEKEAEEGNSNKENDQNKNTKSGLERPEGQSQKDYLRRLSMRISDMERDLKNKGEGIYAIGVLGSDAYDKLMILEALKPTFPNALFFTTDLDTRLNYSEEFEVTRNLLVSASFGLQLGSDFQKAIPPFRDSYQTAFFLATQIALDNANEGGKITQDTINAMLGCARLFETGFTKAIELGVGKCPFNQGGESYHSTQKFRAWPKWKLILAGFAIVCTILFAYVLSERSLTLAGKIKQFAKDCIALDMDLYNLFRKNPKRALILLLPQVLILIVLGVTFYEISLGNKGELFYWSEGVSIWPTELIRLVAGILGCLFIASTASTVERNKQQLSRFFCLDRLPDDQLSNIDDGLCQEDGRINVSMLWNRYCQETSASSRNRRVFLLTLIFSFFLVLLYVFDLPNVPYRGEASLVANYLALLFSVPVFIVLGMMVFDVTWRSVDLITPLANYTSVWPKETLCRFDLEQNISSPEADELAKLRDELSMHNKYHLNKWIDIQFIAAHTKEIGKLVYYPVIIFILMIFARSKIFDNWNMPLGLVLIFLSSGALTLICALYLRRTAERARQAVIKEISSMLIGLSSRPGEAARTLEKQAYIALKQIQEINEGAFLPLVQEPAVQALMLPFGGWGGITLLEHFVLNGF